MKQNYNDNRILLLLHESRSPEIRVKNHEQNDFGSLSYKNLHLTKRRNNFIKSLNRSLAHRLFPRESEKLQIREDHYWFPKISSSKKGKIFILRNE